MKTDIQKLEKLAKGATPGPWVAGGNWVSTAKGGSVAGKGASIADCARGDQHFIAAANPAAVLGLIAELEDQALQTRSAREVCVESQSTILTLIAERDHLIAENERLQHFETAYKEFSDKTDWVRPNAATHELGMHVADILRKRCDDLTSQNQAQADEIKALRKVSARYEWLKKNTTVMLKKTISYVTALGLINTCYPSSLELDDAIDTAMAQEPRP